MLTAYDVLEVSPLAPFDEVRKAYYVYAKRYHPDVYKGHDAHDRMKNGNLAFEAIKENKAFTIKEKESLFPFYGTRLQKIEWINNYIEHCHDALLIPNEVFMALLVGKQDKYTTIWRIEELERMVMDKNPHDNIKLKVRKAFPDFNGYSVKAKCSSYRWYMRGLHIDAAIRKAQIDEKNFAQINDDAVHPF
jgi:curved DNA-binding protein CbpA